MSPAIFSVTLKEPAASGYLWLPVKQSTFLIMEKKYDVDYDNIGSSSKVTFKILPLTNEPVSVTFELRRPFEEDVTESRTFTFYEQTNSIR